MLGEAWTVADLRVFDSLMTRAAQGDDKIFFGVEEFAKLCGISAKTGSINEGLAADLVVLDGNPLADISALKNVSAVYQDGRKMF